MTYSCTCSHIVTHSASTARPIRRPAKVPSPSFDGKQENLRPFVAHFSDKMRLDADQFETEEVKVGFVLQCLSGAAADLLCSDFRHLIDFDVQSGITTLLQFVALLDRYTKDPASQQERGCKTQ